MELEMEGVDRWEVDRWEVDRAEGRVRPVIVIALLARSAGAEFWHARWALGELIRFARARGGVRDGVQADEGQENGEGTLLEFILDVLGEEEVGWTGDGVRRQGELVVGFFL